MHTVMYCKQVCLAGIETNAISRKMSVGIKPTGTGLVNSLQRRKAQNAKITVVQKIEKFLGLSHCGCYVGLYLCGGALPLVEL